MYNWLKSDVFLNLSGKLLPYIAILAIGLLSTGLYLALFASPPDYQQGEAVRIMYIHVPSAWMALFCYSFIAFLSAGFLIWKTPLLDIIARSTAPIGAAFTLITLITGAIWGKPSWGTWWVWDARLTSVLILFFLYLGYIALSNAFENKERAAKAAATLALVGFINIPIIKFSVEWWNTLHQPASVLRMAGPAIHPSMLAPLLLMAGGFLCYFLVALVFRVRAEISKKKIIRLQLKISS